jgi:hypothetical protein
VLTKMTSRERLSLGMSMLSMSVLSIVMVALAILAPACRKTPPPPPRIVILGEARIVGVLPNGNIEVTRAFVLARARYEAKLEAQLRECEGPGGDAVSAGEVMTNVVIPVLLILLTTAMGAIGWFLKGLREDVDKINDKVASRTRTSRRARSSSLLRDKVEQLRVEMHTEYVDKDVPPVGDVASAHARAHQQGARRAH